MCLICVSIMQISFILKFSLVLSENFDFGSNKYTTIDPTALEGL